MNSEWLPVFCSLCSYLSTGVLWLMSGFRGAGILKIDSVPIWICILSFFFPSLEISWYRRDCRQWLVPYLMYWGLWKQALFLLYHCWVVEYFSEFENPSVVFLQILCHFYPFKKYFAIVSNAWSSCSLIILGYLLDSVGCSLTSH